MNDSFSTPVKDISQDLSIIEQDERPTYRRSKRIKRLYGEKDRNVDYWDKLPDEDLLQEFIEVSQNQVNTIIPKGNLQLLTKPNRKFIII